MASIFASKLFVTSTRQERIRAAIADPVNKELVQQLSSYVDFSEPSESESSERSDSKLPTVSRSKTSETHAPKSAPETSEVPSYTSDMGKGGGKETSQPAADDMEDVDKSQLNAATEVEASTRYIKPEPAMQVQITELANVVKGQLNADTHSKGVTRAAIKNENELWVYFNDETNLNDVLTPVLENLNAPDFGYLKFNRFARSDNAIVFTIDMIDSANEVKPETEVNPDDFPGITEMQKRKTAEGVQAQ